MTRIIRDPVYGYIEVNDSESVLINTPEFQRLRHIIQTSYSSVYPSALHNRFVHSLGVHHLGKIAFQSLRPELESLADTYMPELGLDAIEHIFTRACLLHDVGHSPFSHTCENLYELSFKDLEPQPRYSYMTGIEVQLHKCTGCFRKDRNVKEAAKHESMSSMVGVKMLDRVHGWHSQSRVKKQKEFFARCITGYRYPKDHEIENCVISLLNSSTIDVDRIDYLLRDAYFSGYPNVPIDYRRLLGNLTIVEKDGERKVGYRKNAISILENTIYAHDSERKWIQNHPVIVYENFLINGMVSHISSEVCKDSKYRSIINVDTISNEGAVLDDKRYRLLSDNDLLSLSKMYPSNFSEEYHDRSLRRKPCWKSEQEFTSIVRSDLPPDSINWIVDKIGYIEDCMNQSNRICIDDELIKELDPENIRYEVTMRFLEGVRKGLKEFDIVMLEASRFSSGFRKTDFRETLVKFQDRPRLLHEVSPILSQSDSDTDKFFYIYTRNEEDRKNMIAAISDGYRNRSQSVLLEFDNRKR